MHFGRNNVQFSWLKHASHSINEHELICSLQGFQISSEDYVTSENWIVKQIFNVLKWYFLKKKHRKNHKWPRLRYNCTYEYTKVASFQILPPQSFDQS